MKHALSGLIAFLTATVCFSFPLAAQSTDESTERAQHALNRLTYGPRPGDVAMLEKLGVERFIEQQLHPESLPIPKRLQERIDRSPSVAMTPGQLFVNYGRPALRTLVDKNDQTGQQKKDAFKLINETYKKLYLEQSELRLNRALYSPRQLEELMTEFWFNHFNISSDKGLDHIWVGSFEEVAIRPYALGRFRDLLGATAHHAAMLFYLDNWQNSVARVNANGGGRFKGLNENYARELMELHTLGVDGGYSQSDVVALARILTGLGLQPRRGASMDALQSKFGSRFEARRHDFSQKVLLGKTVVGSGEREIEEALDLLAKHPSTAHHLSYKLAQAFVCDHPPDALIKRLCRTFNTSDGDIKAVLKEIFQSPEFWDSQYRESKFKSPYRYVLSALRASDVEVVSFLPVIQFLRQQGMPLYQCLTPDGYKNTEAAWLNSDALLNRLNFATALGLGKLPNLQTSTFQYSEVEPLLGTQPSASTLRVIKQAPEEMRLSLLLGSPEFMRY
jgi:uncharacterized protein (DUF1800 family)